MPIRRVSDGRMQTTSQKSTNSELRIAIDAKPQAEQPCTSLFSNTVESVYELPFFLIGALCSFSKTEQ